MLLPFSIGEVNTQPFELRTTTESLQHAILDAFSLFGRETAAICELGEFTTELRLMKMTSLPIAAECKNPPKSDTFSSYHEMAKLNISERLIDLIRYKYNAITENFPHSSKYFRDKSTEFLKKSHTTILMDIPLNSQITLSLRKMISKRYKKLVKIKNNIMSKNQLFTMEVSNFQLGQMLFGHFELIFLFSSFFFHLSFFLF